MVTGEGWTVGNDLVMPAPTPMFMVKRNRIDERFAAHCDDGEPMGQKALWHAA